MDSQFKPAQHRLGRLAEVRVNPAWRSPAHPFLWWFIPSRIPDGWRAYTALTAQQQFW